MKALSIYKLLLYLPAILFADYLLMILLGCSTCLFGFGEDFYCGTYCLTGKILIGLSLVFFGILVYREIVKSRKAR